MTEFSSFVLDWDAMFQLHRGGRAGTLLLYRQSLSWTEKVLYLQTFLSLLKVLLAGPIWTMTSLAVDSVFSVVLPRYLKLTTSSTSLLPHLMVIGELLVAMPLVLLGLILRPKPSAFCWMIKISAWSLDLQVLRMAILSATSMSLSRQSFRCSSVESMLLSTKIYDDCKQ